MTAAEWQAYGDASASHQTTEIDGKLYTDLANPTLDTNGTQE